MAGFDAWFRTLPHDVPIIRACLDAARRRARTFHVRLNIKQVTDDVTYLRINGQTYGIDIFLERLRRDLPTIAEASASSRRTPAQRRRVALGLVDVLTRYRGSMYDDTPDDWIPTVRAKRNAIMLLPHEVYPSSASSVLQARMFVTMDMLASWHYREVAPEVLLEEVHTAAELLLNASVNRRSKRLSFNELVDAAHAAGLLTAAINFDHQPQVPERLAAIRSGGPRQVLNDIGRDVLISLKDCRKDVRHRAAEGAEQWLNEHFWDIASILERLAPHAR